MKRIVFIIAAAIMLVACGGSSQQMAVQTAGVESAEVKEYSVDQLQEGSMESEVGTRIAVRGRVFLTCVFSGRRCYLHGTDKYDYLRIEATGDDLGGFNRELIGTDIVVIGILRERRITKEYLMRYEKGIIDITGVSEEPCSAEQLNVKVLRDWMEANKTDYYPAYYIDADSYEIVE